MITGKVWMFGNNINTDLMVPGPVLYASEAEQARAVFSATRPGWVDIVKPGDIVVGGTNFGMGSSRPAPRSLRNLGIACVVADSVNGLFYRNCVNFGLVGLECPGVSALFEEGQTAEIDLTRGLIRNAQTGKELSTDPVPEQLLAMMLNGGIYPILEKQGLIGKLWSDRSDHVAAGVGGGGD